MASKCISILTQLPKDVVDIIEKELNQFNSNFDIAKTYGGVDLKTRDSKTTWLSSDHWIGGFCYHYVNKMNRENFQYDIDDFDNQTLQYTSYESGEYYNWHVDADITSQHDGRLRKLSFILQLSDPDDYEGGEVQLMRSQNESIFLPKTRGTISVFDSRTPHRVKKVLSGHRKSLIGWMTGPVWK